MDQEFENIDSSGQWQNLYNEIRNHSQECSCKVAKFPENRIRNRYRDVSPYDHSRVRLEDSENDYINASLITLEEAQRRYILTQGPLKNTCGHFWQMIWEQRSSAVIMLNRLLEKGSEKCAQYWPSKDEHDMTFTDSGFVVTLLSETVDTNYVVRVLELQQTKTGDVRQIHHFHYTAWPDFGVPESPASFLNFLFNVRKTGSLSPENGPAVVHCSAGIGRSGTFSLVDTCLVLMEKSPFSVDIQKILLCMREYRMGLIQTPDQLRFSYLAVKEGAKIVLGEINQQRLITSIPSSDRLHGQSDSGSEPLDVERYKIQSEQKGGKENTSRSNLRKRSSDQKVVSMAQKVQHMKLKLRDSEEKKEKWQFWKSVLLNVGAGAAVAFGLCLCWALLCQ